MTRDRTPTEVDDEALDKAEGGMGRRETSPLVAHELTHVHQVGSTSVWKAPAGIEAKLRTD